jgi:hypothetical protein
VLDDLVHSGVASYWVGTRAPTAALTCSDELLVSGASCREVPSRHGAFRVVYLSEVDLGSVKHWPALLDETIRLLARDCETYIALVFRESHLLTSFSLAHFLRKRTDLGVRVESTTRGGDGEIAMVLRCWRGGQQPTLDSIEIGVITDGRRPNQLLALAGTISNLRGANHIDLSLAVCGPEAAVKTLESAGHRVRWVPEPEDHTEFGWITEKKNRLVSASAAENVLILHDRYAIPADFLERLACFGADFDVVIPRQVQTDGVRFPDYVALSSFDIWTIPGVMEYEDYSPFAYVNGGAILAKRAVLEATPWNHLLFWNQGEDVELTCALAERGIVPRIAPTVALEVTAVRPGYVESFGAIPYATGSYRSIGVTSARTEPTAPLPATGRVAMRGVSLDSLSNAGVVGSHHQWVASETGLRPRDLRGGELVLDLGPDFRSFESISVHGVGYLQELHVNGVRQELSVMEVRGEYESFQEAITLSGRSEGRFVRVYAAGIGLVVSAITCKKEESVWVGTDDSFPLELADLDGEALQRLLNSGWGDREEWGGVWSIGATSEIALPMSLFQSTPSSLRIHAVGLGDAESESCPVGVGLNGIPIGCMSLKRNWEWDWYQVPIPRQLLVGARELHFVFYPLITSSPSVLGLSEDSRYLGFALKGLDFPHI